MNRSKALSALLIFLCCSACGLLSTPQRTLGKYFEATRAGRWDEAYGYLSSKDRAFQPLDAYRTNMIANPFAAGILAKTTYQVKQSTVDGSRASVVVAVTSPDVQGIMGNLMASAMASALSGKGDSNAAVNDLAKNVESGNLPTTTRDEVFAVIKEDGGWKVNLGLEPKARVAEGKQLQEEKKYAEAKIKYEAALSADAENKDAISGLAEVGAAQALMKEQEAYFPKIEIRNLNVKRGRTFMGAFAMLEGEVKNTGERALNRLEVRAVCLDKDGRAVYEADDTVLSVPKNPDSFVALSNPEFSQPLKPNFSRRLLVNLEKAPTDWSGKVEVRVIALEFGE